MICISNLNCITEYCAYSLLYPCRDIESTVRFIARVQEVSQLPVGIKMCMGNSQEFRALIGEMKRQVVFPDWITVDGSEGGTGAAPLR